jgi:hypothetical protein
VSAKFTGSDGLSGGGTQKKYRNQQRHAAYFHAGLDAKKQQSAISIQPVKKHLALSR